MSSPYYDDGLATIYHGEALAVLNDLNVVADMVITDPPYSSGGQFRGDRAQPTSQKYHQADGDWLDALEFTGDNRDGHAYGYWAALWIDRLRALTKPGALVGLFTDWRQLPVTADALQAGGMVWRGIVVWDKTEAARPIQGRWTNQCEFFVWGTNGPRQLEGSPAAGVFRASVPRGEDRYHMTAKPISMLLGLMRLLPPNGLVIDPFMGSGSTLVAAKQVGGRAIGVELEERYCEIAARRLAQGVLEFEDGAA